MDTISQPEKLLWNSQVALYKVDSLGEIPANPTEWNYKGRVTLVTLSESRLEELGVSLVIAVLQFEPNYAHMLFGKLLIGSTPYVNYDGELWVELSCPDIAATFNFASLASEDMITHSETDSYCYVIDHIPYT